MNAILIANEVIDEKRRLVVVFKIDFQKPYNLVNQGFLEHYLERKGLAHNGVLG